MKRAMLLGAVLAALVVSAVGCATATPKIIEKGMVPRGVDAVSVDVVFYQDVDVSDGENVKFIGRRNDSVSAAALGAFEREFRGRLAAEGIKALSGPGLVRVEIKLAYVVIKPNALSEVRWVSGEASVYVAGAREPVLILQCSAGVPLFLPALTLGGPEVAARRGAKMVAERFADVLARRLK